jgi:hypothetical protein
MQFSPILFIYVHLMMINNLSKHAMSDFRSKKQLADYNWVTAEKNSICPKFEKLRYRCHCLSCHLANSPATQMPEK